jgi:predicted HicB family RNase H-like nuclease
MEYKKFGSEITYNRQEQRFDGEVIGASQELTFSGKSVAELRANFELVADRHVARCTAKGTDPYQKLSGKLIVRFSPELHRAISLAARADGKSVNKWIEGVLADHVARRR